MDRDVFLLSVEEGCSREEQRWWEIYCRQEVSRQEQEEAQKIYEKMVREHTTHHAAPRTLLLK